MRTDRSKKVLLELLNRAGVGINGPQPWDIRVNDERFYGRVLSQGSLGAGESYMDGWWDVEQLDELFFRVLRSDIELELVRNWRVLAAISSQVFINKQRKSKAGEIGERHYDLGNTLFRSMLDERLVYSCAYWKEAETLRAAQENKLDLVCRKLGLRSGMHLLDIGCGWGSLAKYAAEKYGVSVVGINNSKEQTELGQALCSGLPIEIIQQDYRDVKGRFDRIASIGMFEHVGTKNYRTYMNVVSDRLKDDGLFLLHTLGRAGRRRGYDGFTQKYIFPRGVVPTIVEFGKSVDGLFTIEDVHNIGAHYDRTLMAWSDNFESNWDQLRHIYDERFHRMWKYFLLSFAGSSRARRNHVWQIVLSKKGVLGGYLAIR
ncbi:MAG: cyclopropane fatty acyl phospholipid synthase [Rhodothermia bacterium]|nr:MAG: cyclopropane fatty acyl phospholipid synthase [Rhodothermia bacterium]